MDDIELTARLAADLDGAFEAFVRAHQDRCYSVALRVLGDAHDAEEVAQDAFVRAYRALGTYDTERIRSLQLRGWIATIVVNLARNRTRARRPATVAIDGNAATPLTDPDPGPEVLAAHREETSRWARLLDGLPARYRVPIVLRHIDELSYPEIATVLRRPEGTIKAQVHRGIAMLRQAYTADAARDAGPPGEVGEPESNGPPAEARAATATASPSSRSPRRLSRAMRLEVAR